MWKYNNLQYRAGALRGKKMSKVMEYKGYVGSVEFSETDGLFYGKVQDVRSLISYEGTDAKSLVEDFHNAVDDYLELCEKEYDDNIGGKDNE